MKKYRKAESRRPKAELVEALAQAAWSVLNHDNPFSESDPTFYSDPCHAANKEILKKKIRAVLKSRKSHED